jgi:hypothetical protein
MKKSPADMWQAICKERVLCPAVVEVRPLFDDVADETTTT